MGLSLSAFRHPEISPDINGGPTFDPLYGFPNGREERKMLVTEEEMEKAQLTASERDYCAHLIIDFYKCRKESFPLVVKCKPVLAKWNQCEFDDYTLRMKEYERERRLLVREQRKKAKEQRETGKVM